MLVVSPRLSADDREQWKLAEDTDRVNCRLARFKRRVTEAREALYQFVSSSGEGCYVGVSWGKDSVVVAHLAVWLEREKRRTLPLVWLRSEPGYNPDCLAVRDDFRRTYPELPYDEIVVPREWRDGAWRSTGPISAGAGFDEARRRWGQRHVSGVRAEESRVRLTRMQRWGESSPHTCAPIGWWSSEDVFSYLHLHGLPVHPAYAMRQHGIWERRNIRVASVGGHRGRGHGRAEWEAHYYPDVIARLRRIYA